jgi:hypothetical protein
MYETRPERLPKSSLSPLPQVNLFVILPHTCIGAPRRRRAFRHAFASVQSADDGKILPPPPPPPIGTPGGKPHVLTEGSGAVL